MGEQKIVINDKEIVVRKQNFETQLKFLNIIPKMKQDFLTRLIKLDIGGKNDVEALFSIVEAVTKEVKIVAGYLSELLDKQVSEKYLLKECDAVDLLEIVHTILVVNRVDKILGYKKKIQGVFEQPQS